MTFVFFGQHSPLSLACLEALLSSGLAPSALVVARKKLEHAGPLQWHAQGTAPTLSGGADRGPSSLLAVGRRLGVPTLETCAINHPQSVAAIASLRPELFVVCGFDTLFTPAILAVPARGALNVHPSLLPRWRGPSPFFWIFKEGDWQAAGVSVHWLDEREDHGPVLARAALPEGARASIDGYLRAAGVAGGASVAQLLLRHGAALPPGTPQDHQLACRAPRPTEADLAIDPTAIDGERLREFVNGVAGSYEPWVQLGADRFVLRAVSDFQPARRIAAQYALRGNVLYLPVADGLAVCEVAAGDQRD